MIWSVIVLFTTTNTISKSLNWNFSYPFTLVHWWNHPRGQCKHLCTRSLRQLQLIWRWLWRTSPPHWSLYLRVGVNKLEEWLRFSATQPLFFCPPSPLSSSILGTRTVGWISWVSSDLVVDLCDRRKSWIIVVLHPKTHSYILYHLSGRYTTTVLMGSMNIWLPHCWHHSGLPVLQLPTFYHFEISSH